MDADQREQHEGDHGADPADRHGAGGHREQRVAGRDPDPRGQTEVSRRVARNAVIPASGTQPSSSTSVTSHGLPPNRVDKTASTPDVRRGLAAEPMPVSW
jgi:hypothetical protein